jgi:hypothetical protein
MNRLIFSTLLEDKGDVSRALLLAESIRAYAGDLSPAPIWVFLSKSVEQLSNQSRAQFDALEVDLHPFQVDSQAASFPFAKKVVASAAAETLAAGKTALLVWMDPGSMVINEPRGMLLEAEEKLGCRPVDHLLIGPAFDKPLDPFWQSIFADCGVRQEALFPMTTSTDQVEMYPYINAGMLVVRPENKLLRSWRDTFLGMYLEPRYQDFYRSNRLYRIFIHQAVLAGCILSTFKQADIVELPYLVNYPLHMHTQYPIDRRPRFINELVSFRYEDFFTDPNWQEVIQVKEPQKSWLKEKQHLFTAA